MAKRLTRKQKRQQGKELEYIVNTKFTMKKVLPMTEAQAKMFDSYNNDQMIAAIGSAGSGKSYVALYLALTDVLQKGEYEKVIVVRSAVQTREQGFMPGTPNEKLSHYEAPYIDIVNDLFERGDAYQILKQKKQVDFISSSFVRGLTWNNAVIIVDEVQSMNAHEIDSIMTRVGDGSKIILCGDTKQDDLKTSRNRRDVSGLAEFLDIIENMPEFDIINFTTDDIVRSGIVRSYLIAKEERELEFA